MIEWSISELQKHIEEITSGQKVIAIDLSHQDLPRYVLFNYPSRQIKRLAELHEDRVTRRAIKDKIMTEEQMETFMRSKGIWTEKDDEKVEEAQEILEKWKLKLIDPDISEQSKGYARELIPKLEDNLFEIDKKRERMLSQTVERLARQEKYDFMVWACTYDIETEERLWDNYLTYCDKIEAEFKSKLLSEFLKYLIGHTTEQIRYIARNNLWRLDYIVSQKGGLHLFPAAAIDLTPDQKNLLWWTSYYQSLNEMLPEDQPDEWVIQDDEALDKYMESLHQERSKEISNRRAERSTGISAEKMATRLIMRSHPDYYKRQYDQVNPHAEGKTDIRVEEEGDAYKAKKLKSVIRKSKKFKPTSEGEVDRG
jgi:hypothetical protein